MDEEGITAAGSRARAVALCQARAGEIHRNDILQPFSATLGSKTVRTPELPGGLRTESSPPPPQGAHALVPATCTKGTCGGKKASQVRLGSGSWCEAVILDYPGGPHRDPENHNGITRILERQRRDAAGHQVRET